MYRKLKNLWESSDFAKENLSFRETVGLLLEKYGYSRDVFLLQKEINCPELVDDFKRAVSGEPLGYVLGKVPFYKEEYFVEEGVLIPRCDSETLVETAIEYLPRNTKFYDICTGSGCIGLSVANNRRDLTATLLDISPHSEKVAKKNVAALKLSDRVSFRRFDLFKDCDTLHDFSAVVMNPPYITASEMKQLPKNVLSEPSLALDGGEDGLDFYRFVAGSEVFDRKILIFEIGNKQGDALIELFGKGKIIKDLSGNDRVFLRLEE